MRWNDDNVREVIGLALRLSAGDTINGAQRFREITGVDIGEARHATMYETILMFSYHPETGEIVSMQRVRGAFPGLNAGFEKFSEDARNAELPCEMFGRRWQYEADRVGPWCMASKRREDNVDIALIVERAFARLDVMDADFRPNEFQKAVLSVYAQGDNAWCSEVQGRSAFYAAIESLEDPFIRFIIRELDEEEGLETKEDAISRLRMIGADADEMLEAIEKVSETGWKP